jgi:hypothetical protein
MGDEAGSAANAHDPDSNADARRKKQPETEEIFISVSIGEFAAQ